MKLKKKNIQEEIFNVILKMDSLKLIDIKGNVIHKKLYNKFKKEFDKKNFDKFNCYSSEEEDLGEDEEKEEEEIEVKKDNKEDKKEEIDITEEITKKMEKMDIHK